MTLFPFKTDHACTRNLRQGTRLEHAVMHAPP